MKRIRNGVVIILLCIIGAYKTYKPSAPVLNSPPDEQFHDSVSGNPVNASRPADLRLSNTEEDQFRDSVAGNAIPSQSGGKRGNTEDQTPPPPRGGDHHGFGPQGAPNPGSQLPPPALSPSGPPSNPRL